MGETTKYDVAVLGLWWSSNYGSIMIYYSLYRLIESYGYRTVIISPAGNRDKMISCSRQSGKTVSAGTFPGNAGFSVP